MARHVGDVGQRRAGLGGEAEFVDGHLAVATDALLDAARIAERRRSPRARRGPGGAGLAAAQRVGPKGSIVLSDDAPEMVAVAARRAIGYPQVSTAVEPDVREQMAQRAMDAGAENSRRDGDQIVFPGSVLIAAGLAPQH